jgi:hypothetical protein
MAAAAPSPAMPARPRPAWSGWRIVLVVLGSLAALVGVAFAMGGGALMIGHLTQRDDDGYLTSPHESVASSGYAVTAEGIDLANLDDGGRWLVEQGLGHVRIRATSATSDPIFVGIAPETRLDRYLSGVAHDELDDVRAGVNDYTTRSGGGPDVAPSDAPIWAASASGAGTQTLGWDARDGRWSVVVMNADGARAVAADVTVGAKLGVLPWIAAGLLLAGLLMLAVGGGMIAAAVRGGVATTAVANVNEYAPSASTPERTDHD